MAMNKVVTKPSSDILERLRKCSTEHTDEVFTRIYRYLLREDIYIAAYQNLYANDGAMTKGIDNDTADGFGIEYIRDLIKDLRNGTYHATPVRRVYIPKKNGKKLRPLGVPSFRDKLLQDVVRMYLEAIYEPLFDNCSHGFRPQRSCHSALAQIKKTFNGVPWIIEGDISKCFDTIDHEILLRIIAKKIKDERLLQVIREFLKSGYMDNWVYNETYSGAAQGGIISPLLMNIYMNELDRKIHDISKDFEGESPVEENPPNREYVAIRSKITRLNQKIEQADEKDRKTLILQRKELQKQLRKIPSKTPIIKRLYYVRYADDWLVGVHGSKNDCVRIKSIIASFLNDELKLTLSEEKTLITHSDKKVRFLGYDVSVSRSQALRRSEKTGHLSRSLYKHVVLSVPLEDKIMPFLWNKNAIKQTEDGSIKPKGRKEYLFARDDEIVRMYNSEVRGILNYYNMAGNYNDLSYFRYLMEYSCLFTLARKHNMSTKQIIRKYRDGQSWSVPYYTKTGMKRIGIASLKDCKFRSQSDQIQTYKPYKRKELWRRIAANTCEYCGVKSEEHCKVFVTRRLKDLGDEPWANVMKVMRRKTLIVCPACYNLIHISH
jgi:group II intron reverse transcriptase/maturase